MARCAVPRKVIQPATVRARVVPSKSGHFLVIFSIFGWKRAPPKKAGKPVAEKAGPAQAGPSGSTLGAEIPEARGEDSLDFSEYVPPPKTEPEAAGQNPVSATAPAVPQRWGQAPTMPPEVGAFLSDLDPAPAAEEVPPIVEKAATLFASGQAAQALSALAPSVRDADIVATEQMWLVLFDLYQYLGMKEEFEALALEFVVKFERSPPTWIDTGEPRDPALATGVACIALGRELTGASGPGLATLRNAVADGRTVRVECGELERIDGAGCKLLLETVLSFREAGKGMVLTGEERLVRFLEETCSAGGKETDPAVWALLFEVYRVVGLQGQFEEAAVNYAVTFEVSPPSWESQPRTEAKRPAVTGPAGEADQDLALSGELLGASEDLARQLQDRAAIGQTLVVDMSGAKRVDPATAELMLNALSKLRQTGVTIEIRGANELIRALFCIKGLSRLARIIPRK
jgi:ABC-type transporter Mla MlaB component